MNAVGNGWFVASRLNVRRRLLSCRFATEKSKAFAHALRAFWASFFWDDCQKKLALSEAGRNAFDFHPRSGLNKRF
jgi:hypothetical protein